MSFNLNKLVQPECGGPNPLVRAAQQITNSTPMSVPPMRFAQYNQINRMATPGHAQLDFVKDFVQEQQVPRAGTSSMMMSVTQQQMQNLSLHSQQHSQQSHQQQPMTSNISAPAYQQQLNSNTHMMGLVNPMVAMSAYPVTSAATATGQYQQPQSEISGANQLEAKYRSDMMSHATEENKQSQDAINQQQGKLDDMEFWQGLAQTYMGPTTYSNIAKAKLTQDQGASTSTTTTTTATTDEKQVEEKGAEVKEDEGEYLDSAQAGEMFDKLVDTNEYHFDDKNPLKDQFEDPFQEGLKRLEAGDIPSAALLFEAAVQKEPENALAWRYLGTTQAQNEKDKSAIAALTECIKLDPTDLQAHLSISVSLVNEYQKGPACDHLLMWLRNNERYAHIASNLTEFQALRVDKYSYNEDVVGGGAVDKTVGDNKWDYLRVRFFEAARMSPDNPDPDVQTALGLLYSLSSDYQKAIDCFRSALSVKPRDSLIWNRLGATLANSNRNEEAVVAYRRALELSPGFLRSRYNLAVSLVQLNCYEAAAKQLVQVLNIQAAGVGARGATSAPRARVATSSSIWNTLRTTVTLMNRPDLYPMIDGRNLAECNAKLVNNSPATAETNSSAAGGGGEQPSASINSSSSSS